MTKTVFLTGAAGLIGKSLAAKLVARGDRVICFDLGEQFTRYREFFLKLEKTGQARIHPGTILDRIGMTKEMASADAVVHLAAMLGVRRTEANKLRCFEINTQGTDNVLDACIRNRIGHVVFASSSEVYGEPSHNPITEEQETKGKTVYAVSKMAGEELVKGYAQLYPWLNYTVVRFFNTYGEGQVAQFVLMKFIQKVLAGQNPIVFGDGDQMRSYGHVDDVTEGVIKILDNERARNQVYNLGNSSQLFSLKELAQKVIDVLAPDKGLQVEVVGDFKGTDRTEKREIFTRYCDTSKAARELGFSPTITVEEGIRRIVAAGEIHGDWPFNP